MKLGKCGSCGTQLKELKGENLKITVYCPGESCNRFLFNGNIIDFSYEKYQEERKNNWKNNGGNE